MSELTHFDKTITSPIEESDGGSGSVPAKADQTETPAENIQMAESLQPTGRQQLIVQLLDSLPEEIRYDLLSQYLNVSKERLEAFVKEPIGKVYSAPRRFDLATIFVVTAAFSLILAAMKWMSLPPLAICFVAGFIAITGIAQAMLFGGRKPRRASAFTGIVMYLLFLLVPAMLYPRLNGGDWYLGILVICVVYGSILGYVAGALVGGIFLVADAFRKRLAVPSSANKERTTQQAVQEKESPWHN